MTTKKRFAGDLQPGDQITLPKNTVSILEFRETKYYRLPCKKKGDLRCVLIRYDDGPMKGHMATMIMDSEDMVHYVLKDPPFKRFWKYVKKALQKAIKKHQKEQNKEYATIWIQ